MNDMTTKYVAVYVIAMFIAYCVTYWHTEDDDKAVMSGLLWPLALAALLVVLPFAGLRKIIDEIKDKRLRDYWEGK